MKRFRRISVSPSMMVALLALFVALSGSAYAAAKINGKNLKNRSVANTKIKKNTLGKNEIKESSIAPFMPNVPSATHAAAATTIDGFAKFGTSQPAGTAETEIYNSGKLRLTEECDGTGALTLRAYTLVDNATFSSYGRSSDTNDDDYDIADNPLTISADDDERDAVYTDPGGQTVALQWGAAEQPGLTGGGCLVSGFAIAK